MTRVSPSEVFQLHAVMRTLKQNEDNHWNMLDHFGTLQEPTPDSLEEMVREINQWQADLARRGKKLVQSGGEYWLENKKS
ncbi:hypothetical protein ANAEL_03708 [Anaerolineales bacterium]|nr:hypothetical protein ANAEL_03708 [Anaerolineales bacterium]